MAQLARVTKYAEVECYEDKPIVHGLLSAARRLIWGGVRSTLQLIYAAETGSFQDRIFSQNLVAVLRKGRGAMEHDYGT